MPTIVLILCRVCKISIVFQRLIDWGQKFDYNVIYDDL